MRARFLVLARSMTRHPGLKLLSLSVAVVAWLYVQGSEQVEGKLRVPLSWQLPETLLAIEPLPASVTLTVRGPRNAIRRAAQMDLQLPVDLGTVGTGAQALDFASLPLVGLPSNVEPLELQPASVRFTLDEVAARKVRIKPRLVGDLAEGYEVAAVQVRPQVVSLRGPRAVVEALTEVSTLPIDISLYSRDIEQRVDLDLPRTVVLVSDENIRVDVDVSPTRIRRVFSAVPVQVWRTDSYRSMPPEVEVVLDGPSAAMNSVNSNDIVVFAHLPDEPTEAVYRAAFGPTEGQRLRVLHGGGPDILAISVEPQAVRLERE